MPFVSNIQRDITESFKMKKFIATCFIISLFWSCSLEDDSVIFRNELVAIESVSMPINFAHQQIHNISYTYYRPSTCHLFQSLYHVAENNTSTVAVINSVYEDDNCETLTEELVERSFEFTPLNYGEYVFKFWTGVDDNGEDEFLIYEIVVEE